MASFMKRTAARYQTPHTSSLTLPKMKSVRLALNVAECDGLPLVVAFHPQPEQRTQLEDRLTKVAFSEALRGRFVYAATSDPAELDVLGLSQQTPGVYAVDPDTFGLKGTQIARVPDDATAEEMTSQLQKIAAQRDHEEKSHRTHVLAGQRAGISWKTEIPVTDPGSIKAMQRRSAR